MSRICILNDRNKTGCNACPPTCQHMIATTGRIKAANLPAEYRHLTLANSPAREQQAEAYTVIERYIETFKRGTDIKSLYLYSAETGTGKTTTASVVLTEYIIASYLGALRAGEQPPQQPAYFLDVNEWQTLYNGFNRSNIPQDIAERYSRPYYEMMERAKKSPFTVMDDIGVRQASDAFRADLHTIINYRVTNGLPTVWTSNIPIGELETVFDRRLYDRIRDKKKTAVIEFKGESQRGVR